MRGRAVLLTGVVAAAMLIPVNSASAVDEINTQRLRNAVNSAGILSHERVLQRIANNNGGTRASGTPGYQASVDYVAGKLRAAHYDVSIQEFEFPFFDDNSSLTVGGTEIETGALTFSGEGTVSGELVPAAGIQIPPPAEAGTTTSGCSAADFTPAPAEPSVALVQRGTCNFSVKVDNAVAAGYDAVIIFNEGQVGRDGVLAGTLGVQYDVPVIGISYADGVDLYEATQAGALDVDVNVDITNDTRTTYNVIADSKGGDENKVVVVGAHLDSVTKGPGINDNGSGTATNLETAIQMDKLNIKPRQKVRFAFWGAEELGLLGSTHYVESLSDDGLSQIYANLNFDMLGSTNYVRFVYDGDGSSEGPVGPNGSAQIESIFNDYFASKNLATAPTAFDGRSDYGPFIAVGIPAGGLFSGAEGIKTEEEAAIYGGTAGEPYDPCYHQACDTTNNLSTKALGEMGDAVAHSVMTLARTKTGFFEDGSRMAARQAISMDQFDFRGGQAVR